MSSLKPKQGKEKAQGECNEEERLLTLVYEHVYHDDGKRSRAKRENVLTDDERSGKLKRRSWRLDFVNCKVVLGDGI